METVNLYKDTLVTPKMVSLFRDEATTSIYRFLGKECHGICVSDKCENSEIKFNLEWKAFFSRCENSDCSAKGKVIFDQKKFESLFSNPTPVHDNTPSPVNRVRHSLSTVPCTEASNLHAKEFCVKTRFDTEAYSTNLDGVREWSSHTTGSAVLNLQVKSEFRLKIALKYPATEAGGFKCDSVKITLRDINHPSKEPIQFVRNNLRDAESYHIKDSLKSAKKCVTLEGVDPGLYAVEYSITGAFVSGSENVFDEFGLCDLDPKLLKLYTIFKKHWTEYKANKAELFKSMKGREISDVFAYRMYVDFCNL